MILPLHLAGEAAKRIPPEVFATGCLAFGLVLVFLGWSFYRLALMTVGAGVGFAVGRSLGTILHTGFDPIYPALALAILLGLGALLLEKLGAFLLGGILAGGPVAIIMMHQWRGGSGILLAAIAFVIGGLVVVLVWRPIIIIGLAAVGAAMAANGALLILEHVKPSLAAKVISTGRVWLWLAIGFVAICGILFQIREEDTEEEGPGDDK